MSTISYVVIVSSDCYKNGEQCCKNDDRVTKTFKEKIISFEDVYVWFMQNSPQQIDLISCVFCFIVGVYYYPLVSNSAGVTDPRKFRWFKSSEVFSRFEF